MKAAVVMVAKRDGQKVKRFTTRQLHAERRRAAKEAKLEAKAERAQARSLDRRGRRATVAFRGCDPERTLALLGEDA